MNAHEKIVIGYLLHPRGYCFGVKRTVDMLDQVLKLYKSVYVIEDIVHSKLFMDNALARGIIKVHSINDVPDGSAIMFSSRGISQKTLKKADEKQLTVIDATCPVVKKLQEEVIDKAGKGYVVIIIGNRAHQQIATLLGSIDSDDVYVVNSEMDIDLLPSFDGRKVAYFTQTSLFPGDIRKITDALKSKIPDIIHGRPDIEHDVCAETLDRQAVIAEIAPTIDLLLVLGASYSANAMSLVRCGLSNNIKNVIRIDSREGIQKDILNGINSFALISSTSVDEPVIKDIENSLQNLAGIEYIIYPEIEGQQALA